MMIKTPKFKIGDIVVCIDNSEYEEALTVGQRYIVTGTTQQTGSFIFINMPNGGWAARRFELVEVTPQEMCEAFGAFVKYIFTPPPPPAITLGCRVKKINGPNFQYTYIVVGEPRSALGTMYAAVWNEQAHRFTSFLLDWLEYVDKGEQP